MQENNRYYFRVELQCKYVHNTCARVRRLKFFFFQRQMEDLKRNTSNTFKLGNNL